MIRKANKRTGKGFEIQFYSDADGSASSVIAVDTVEELAQFLARGCWGQNLGENLPTIWKDGERWCFREYTPVSDDNNIQSTDVYLITVISPEGSPPVITEIPPAPAGRAHTTAATGR